jgi:iron complex outermembrane receptor protein
VFELPSVTVVGTTPLPGLGTPLKDVPANVQIFGRRDFDRQRPLELTDFLGANANSVNVGAAQGNAYQQDIAFRGLTASPLLGAAQGLSVFQDGVRINEAFGDVVNWDLIPQAAISSVQLIPRSNPVFGLNTLGGARRISAPTATRSEPARICPRRTSAAATIIPARSLPTHSRSPIGGR